LLWIPALGYLIAFAPLIPVQRPLFLPLLVAADLRAVFRAAVAGSHVGWIRPGGFRDQRPSFFTATTVLVLGFLAASPFMFPFIKMPEYKTMMYGILPIWN
jgi:hypothetical protein